MAPVTANGSEPAEEGSPAHAAKFSPSKLDCYKECPRRYYYRYVERIKRGEQSVEAFLGDCVHKTFESLYEDVQHGKVPTLDELFSRYERLWDEGWSAEIKLRGGYGPQDWRALGRQCVQSYYEARKPFDSDRTVAVERRVGFSLAVDGAPARIEGFVDRLALGKDGAFEIHDYKTGRTLPTQQDVDEDWQLAIYDIAVRDAWPDAREVRLLWHYVRHGKTLVSTRSDERRRSLLAQIAALVSRIRRDREFPPQESALCAYCEYRDLCPLFAHAEQAAAGAPTAADGAALVDKLASLEARKKELRGELKALETQAGALEAEVVRYAQAHGFARVAGSFGEATVVEKEELKLPTKTSAPKAHEELESALKALPIWPEISHLDAHALLSAHQAGAWSAEIRARVGELLARFGRAHQGKSLRFRRRRDTEDD